MIITQSKQTDSEGNCSTVYTCRSTALEDYLLQTQYSVLASIQYCFPCSSPVSFKPKHRSLIALRRETANSQLEKILY
ncbi:MAG: hypothetical protein AABW48_00855 [Nanoarchaeota archaeon]